MTLSTIAVPVFLETTDSPAQIYDQFVRTFNYGHRVMPAMAVATCTLYGIAAYGRMATKRQWRPLLLAAAVTITMVPFTWGFMMPTNNTLFRLHEESEALSTSLGGLAEAQALLRKWSWLHLVRSCFPLAGAVIGLFATLE